LARIVELPARRDTERDVPEGYRIWNEECFACHRDFRVCVPAEDPLGAILTRDILCPHCHRRRVEVLAERSPRDILVVPTERSWAEWRLRRARQLLRTGWRRAQIRGEQGARTVLRLVRSGASRVSRADSRTKA
jgi:hypothetical protein